MNENFQSLMQQLGEAINHAVLNSTEVDEALDQVRANGIDVFLVLEATICVRRKDGASIDTKLGDVIPVDAEDEDIDLSNEDKQFLKRLRISLDAE